MDSVTSVPKVVHFMQVAATQRNWRNVFFLFFCRTCHLLRSTSFSRDPSFGFALRTGDLSILCLSHDTHLHFFCVMF
jgi:hypothetical protein